MKTQREQKTAIFLYDKILEPTNDEPNKYKTGENQMTIFLTIKNEQDYNAKADQLFYQLTKQISKFIEENKDNLIE